MNKFFTFFICLLSLQIVKASAAPVSEILAEGNPELQKNKDTSLLHAPNQYQPWHVTLTERRLDSIKKDIPLDYNEFVQTNIDQYTANRDEMGQVIGLSKYYFPIYEKIFRDAGIPEEIKYLSIVESKLDPNAISRVGATGPWQFMTPTAKLYGLNMDGFVDERRDPVRATYAAAAYLKDAYEEFGDWLLAIASYNCGKSNVENAIAQAGASDFWSIRPFLPAETRNYVPAYIAVAYVMNYYSKHDIVAQPCRFAFKVDTVKVDRSISLYSISNILNIDLKTLALLNPSYLMQSVNGSPSNPRRLIIPQCSKSSYAALYNALNSGAYPNAAPQVVKAYAPAVLLPKDTKQDDLPAYHKVKKGETLGAIADEYGIDLEDLKAWNHLQHNKAVVGQVLKLSDDKIDKQPLAAKN
jgi:membrane-bound lytic murein transglycosylase D